MEIFAVSHIFVIVLYEAYSEYVSTFVLMNHRFITTVTGVSPELQF